MNRKSWGFNSALAFKRISANHREQKFEKHKRICLNQSELADTWQREVEIQYDDVEPFQTNVTHNQTNVTLNQTVGIVPQTQSLQPVPSVSTALVKKLPGRLKEALKENTVARLQRQRDDYIEEKEKVVNSENPSERYQRYAKKPVVISRVPAVSSRVTQQIRQHTQPVFQSQSGTPSVQSQV